MATNALTSPISGQIFYEQNIWSDIQLAAGVPTPLSPRPMAVESIIVQSANANTVTITLRDSLAAAARGFEISPGQVMVLAVSGRYDNMLGTMAPGPGKNFLTYPEARPAASHVMLNAADFYLFSPAAVLTQLVHIVFSIRVKG